MKKTYKFKDYTLELIRDDNIKLYEIKVGSGLVFENQKVRSLDKKNVCKVYLDKLLDKKVFKYYIKSGENLLGIISISLGIEELELGYYIEKNYRRRGIMSFIMKEVINILNSDKRIVCYTEENNIASKKMLESLGFYPQLINNKLKYYYEGR